MARHRALVVVLSAATVLSHPAARVSADTWRWEPGQDWKSVSPEAQDRYLMAVARTEKLVEAGQTKALKKEWQELKKLFPEIAEADLDTFIKAELDFCAGQYPRASRRYEQFLDKNYADSPLYRAALERQYHMASAFLAGRKLKVLRLIELKGYATGVKIMEQISERAGDKPIGLQALLDLARHYEQRDKFHEAYLTWSEISWQRQTGPIARDALLGMARCKHAAYRGPAYNAAHLKSARSYYEGFKTRYPEQAAELKVDEILKQIDEQMAFKQFFIGQYYQRTGKTQAANLYYDMVMRNWSETQAAAMAKEVLDKSLHGEQRDK